MKSVVRSAERTALQRRFDALRTVPRNERPEDTLHVFSQALQELQEIVKEEVRGLIDVKGHSTIYGVDPHGEDQRRKEWNKEAFEQILQLLHRAEAIGDEVCSYCVDEDIMGSSIRESRKQNSIIPCLQPPLLVAEMLMLVHDSYVLLRELHAYRGRVFPDSSLEDNTAAIEYAKSAYVLERRVATITQQFREKKPLQALSTVDNTANRLTAIENECNILQFARSEMQLGVLYGLIGQHEMALMNARAAVQLLTSITPSRTKLLSVSENDNPMVKEAQKLLAVASYNLGCQLEQLITVDLRVEDRKAMEVEKQMAFDQALQLGRQCLEPGHPLLQELQRGVHPSTQTAISKKTSSTTATSTATGIEGGGGGGNAVLAAARRASSGSNFYPMLQLVQPTTALPSLPPLRSSGRRPSQVLNFSIPIGIYDVPSTESLQNASRTDTVSSAFMHSLRDRLASLRSEQTSHRAHPSVFVPPSMKTVPFPVNKNVKGRKSSALLWSPTKKKNQKQTSMQPGQDILNCHRLRRPSDALRLGGIAVLDTLFIQQHKEAEAEKKRKEEEKKMRRRKRRERSFLPESWSIVEDAPLAPKKKERSKKKKKRSNDKRYQYKIHGGYVDGERDMEEDEDEDEDTREGKVGDGFVFPDRSTKKKKKQRGKKAEGEHGEEGEGEGEEGTDEDKKRRKRKKKIKATEEEGSVISTSYSLDGSALTDSVKHGSILRATSTDSEINTSTDKSSNTNGIGMSLAKKVEGLIAKMKKGEKDKKDSEKDDEEEEDEDEDESDEDESDEDESESESEDEDHKLKNKDEDESDDDEDDEPETVNEAKERCETELLTYYEIMYKRRMKAALRIQCAWRCNRARKELHRRQQILYREVYRIQKAAAMCIEGFFCIILEKRRLMQAQERCAAQVAAREVYEEKVLRSVLIISHYGKIFLRRRRRERDLCKLLSLRNVEELRVREAAATIIARWWRIVPAQRAYWQRRTIEVQQQREEEELERRRQFAAVQLQRHFRGMLGRREALQYRQRRVEEHRQRQQQLRECTDLVRLCLQEYTRRCERLALEAQQEEQRRSEAAAIIQMNWRTALQRQMMRNVITRCRRIVRAVLTIQRGYRRFCAGREIRYLRRMQQAVQQERIDRECYEYRATLTLQCFARMVLAKRTARHRRAAIGRGFFFAAIAIQSACRGGTARQQLGAALHMRRRTELLLQSIAEAQRRRVADVLAAFLQARASGFVVETRRCRRLTEKLYLRRRVRWELLRDKSATIIQKAFRRMRKRRLEREAAEQQQQQRALVLRCVIRIQALMRGALARKEFRHRRFLVQKQQRKREEMEEVMLQCFLDEWRAALLQNEVDRRRIKVMESQERELLEYYSKMGVGDALAAATALAEAAKKATVTRVLHNSIHNDSNNNDENEDECNVSTYRDDP
ncbi:uncharacterized protein TM35_000252000 [Trypanosoma theileri]|uniref:Uncharacterized protein n=1 Tax=Trypanosoma theileri TaxID=67003 RepID=A0A1X0NQC8_9TRYP|nr:uncharacterized protein TM35_000252000 [Trypanosoma theileri]ORC86904.1 hypothetical protein TM35_000252000 [Trypanosoma theileri]